MSLAEKNEVSLIFIKNLLFLGRFTFWMNIAVQFISTVKTKCFLYAKLEKTKLPKVIGRNAYNLHSPTIQ